MKYSNEILTIHIFQNLCTQSKNNVPYSEKTHISDNLVVLIKMTSKNLL